eukprot:snap_masked-scaffold_138-processed-gene-0.1-mRNA-1 protein AED:1.00 eAED:1.00 QI:0/-1/0/0/-1/1/1/0/82
MLQLNMGSQIILEFVGLKFGFEVLKKRNDGRNGVFHSRGMIINQELQIPFEELKEIRRKAKDKFERKGVRFSWRKVPLLSLD